MTMQNGFTLVELLVTIAIATILLTVGIPSFTAIIERQQMTSKTNELLATLNTARSEALTEGESVIVCGSTNGNGCDTTDWEQGWIAFVDNNGNDSYDSADERRIRAQSASDGFTRIRPEDNAGNPLTRVDYAADGYFADSDAVSITLCDDNGAASANSINIAPTGKPSGGKDRDDDGKVEKRNGSSVSCP